MTVDLAALQGDWDVRTDLLHLADSTITTLLDRAPHRVALGISILNGGQITFGPRSGESISWGQIGQHPDIFWYYWFKHCVIVGFEWYASNFSGGIVDVSVVEILQSSRAP